MTATVSGLIDLFTAHLLTINKYPLCERLTHPLHSRRHIDRLHPGDESI